MKKPASTKTSSATKKPSDATASNEVTGLAEALGLSVAGNPDWKATISLSEKQNDVWIHLWLKSSEKTYWMVTLRRGGDPTSYTNRSGIDVSDPIGLPKLNALSELPGWLRKVEKKIGASFPPSKLEIKAGRHRKLVGELRSWLES